MSAATATFDLTSPFGALAAFGAAEREALVAHVRPLVGGPQDAEDVAHDAILRALEKRALYDPARPLLAWLKGIAHNLAADRLRRQACVRFRPLGADFDPPAAREPGPDSLGRDLPAGTLGAALERLPERERSALRLFYDEERSVAEIAERLSAPAATVKSWLNRGRERLRARLVEALSAGAAAAILLSLGGAIAWAVPSAQAEVRCALLTQRVARAPVDVESLARDLAATRARFAWGEL